MAPRLDHTGERFGRLTVVSRHNRTGDTFWLCRCDCGRSNCVRGDRLRLGVTKSCGCLASEKSGNRQRTHGKTDSPEYVAWCQIKKRVSNPAYDHFARYGGRGITMADTWRASFETFLADVGPRPSPRHSIDRINNDGHYEPGNVQWVNRVQQANNKRNNRLLVADGKSMTIANWARHLGIPARRIITRLHRGWSDAEALTPRRMKPCDRYK